MLPPFRARLAKKSTSSGAISILFRAARTSFVDTVPSSFASKILRYSETFMSVLISLWNRRAGARQGTEGGSGGGTG